MDLSLLCTRWSDPEEKNPVPQWKEFSVTNHLRGWLISDPLWSSFTKRAGPCASPKKALKRRWTGIEYSWTAGLMLPFRELLGQWTYPVFIHGLERGHRWKDSGMLQSVAGLNALSSLQKHGFGRRECGYRGMPAIINRKTPRKSARWSWRTTIKWKLLLAGWCL